jgi:metal-responsive CopG/Arc/MetJ family transcriptional regulator
MAKISLNIEDSILQAFDNLWKTEEWESRQEAIIFLLKQALARGYISKEKAEVSKAVGGGKA